MNSSECHPRAPPVQQCHGFADLFLSPGPGYVPLCAPQYLKHTMQAETLFRNESLAWETRPELGFPYQLALEEP